MSIYTKVGDSGKTKFRGEMLSKSHQFFHILGAFDEAQAAIGMAYEQVGDYVLHKVMQEIYFISGMFYKDEFEWDMIDAWIRFMEDEIDRRKIVLDHFVLPDKRSHVHFARTVVRRVERTLVIWEQLELVKYFNRLSDLLFAIAVDGVV